MTALTIIPTPAAHTRGQAIPAPAVVALHLAGGTAAQVARRMGATRQYVSLALNGRTPVTPRLRAALVAVVGRDGAAAVISQIPTTPLEAA